MKRLIWLPLAGALLIGGAAVTAAAPNAIDDVTSAVASMPGQAGNLLTEVLSDLVGQDVITQAQADAITAELDTRVEAKRAEMEANREQMRAFAEQMRGFLDDEAITADELAQLPDGEMKTALEALLEDGDITVDRLREMGGLFGRGQGGPGHGHGPGHFRDGGPFAPDAPADDATETDSQDS